MSDREAEIQSEVWRIKGRARDQKRGLSRGERARLAELRSEENRLMVEADKARSAALRLPVPKPAITRPAAPRPPAWYPQGKNKGDWANGV
ncbi:hypothetical protein [Rhodococcus sp. MALMAid1271]|uniref:hypothetical protein n=1 Tax=Rhodococcus sp. MALMAid1271 TaxID=3411744 RepID=UPI003BA2F9C7